MQQPHKIDLKAVLFGFLADTLITLLISIALVSAMAAAGIREHDILERMKSTSGLMLTLVFGLGCTVLGGYIAGRVAQREEIKHGAIVAALGLLLGLFFRESGLPLWYELASFVFIIPAGMAGGHLALQRRQKGSHQAE